jgi:hypothetical protein
MGKVVRTVEEAVEAMLDVRTITSLNKVPGAAEEVQQVLYDAYVKEAVDAEVHRQKEIIISKHIQHTGDETPITVLTPEQIEAATTPKVEPLTFFLTTHDITSRKFNGMIKALEGRLADQYESKMWKTTVGNAHVLQVATPDFRSNEVMIFVDGYLAGWRDARFS